jgi:hypothetical protein
MRIFTVLRISMANCSVYDPGAETDSSDMFEHANLQASSVNVARMNVLSTKCIHLQHSARLNNWRTPPSATTSNTAICVSNGIIAS